MTAATILQPGELEQPAGDIPRIFVPARAAVFHDRAARMRSLAPGHAMREFLLFIARLCDAQQAALDNFPRVPLPDEEQLALCRAHGMPPLAIQGWRRDPAWQGTLGRICEHMSDHAAPAIGDTLARIRQTGAAALDELADSILSGRLAAGHAHAAAAPFVAAALQTYWTHMATALGTAAFAPTGIGNLCPACGSAPVASVVRIGGAEHGLRYLSCSLCETQWHMVRIKCTNCESTGGISYYAVAGSSGAVKAEACDECGSYLKIAYMDKDPHADPVADDLATLALDLLMDESGRSRSGPNLLLAGAA